jgi:hypothetical protein
MSRTGLPPSIYRVRVEGELDPAWSAWFDGLTITHDADGNTTLAGPVPDQAALCGLLGKVCDLGLVLILVARVEPEPAAPARVPSSSQSD